VKEVAWLRGSVEKAHPIFFPLPAFLCKPLAQVGFGFQGGEREEEEEAALCS
jgi:hypothetical protein